MTTTTDHATHPDHANAPSPDDAETLPPGPALAVLLDRLSGTPSASGTSGELGVPAASGTSAERGQLGASGTSTELEGDPDTSGTSTKLEGDPDTSGTSTKLEGDLDTSGTSGELGVPGASGAPGGLGELADHELVSVLIGWRRLSSWVQAAELEVVAELEARAQAGCPRGMMQSQVISAVGSEIALALTLTEHSAAVLQGLAHSLVRQLPDTGALLKSGAIDLPRARVIATGLTGVSHAAAQAVEAAVLPHAPGMTTGRLRAFVAAKLAELAPEEVAAKAKAAQKDRRVEVREDGQGTATLLGLNLPLIATVAATNRITALAKAYKNNGDPRTMDQLRADVLLMSMLGQIPGPHVPSTTPTGSTPPGSTPPGSTPPGDTTSGHTPSGSMSPGTPACPTPTAGSTGTPRTGTPRTGTPRTGTPRTGTTPTGEPPAAPTPEDPAPADARHTSGAPGDTPSTSDPQTGTAPLGTAPLGTNPATVNPATVNPARATTAGASRHPDHPLPPTERQDGPQGPEPVHEQHERPEQNRPNEKDEHGGPEDEGISPQVPWPQIPSPEWPPEAAYADAISDTGLLGTLEHLTQHQDLYEDSRGDPIWDSYQTMRDDPPGQRHGERFQAGGAGPHHGDADDEGNARDRTNSSDLHNSNDLRNSGDPHRLSGPDHPHDLRSADDAGHAVSGNVDDDGDEGDGAPTPEWLMRAAAQQFSGPHIVVTLPALLHLASTPARLGGYAPLVADIIRQILQHQHATDVTACQWTVTDTGGTALYHGQTRYRPSPALRRLIQTRDQTCRFPNCRRPATACDLDHTHPHDQGGPTCPCNMAPLCRRHHQLKVRHEALVHRMGVKDLHRRSVTAER